MTPADLLRDAFGRLPEVVHDAVDGLSDGDLAVRLDADANSVAWLVWHLARVQDDHVAAAFGSDELWATDGWRERFALPDDVVGIGYGHARDQVGAVRASAEVLTGYYDAVHARTTQLLSTVTAGDLDRVVDITTRTAATAELAPACSGRRAAAAESQTGVTSWRQ